MRPNSTADVEMSVSAYMRVDQPPPLSLMPLNHKNPISRLTLSESNGKPLRNLSKKETWLPPRSHLPLNQ
jgi:hypothetical protein